MSERVIEPKPWISARAHVPSWAQYEQLYRESVADPSAFWGKQARRLDFFHPFAQVTQEDFARGEFAWFLGGKLNAAWNCVDRHLADKAHQTAILWAADEPGQYRRISYQELY